jgi:hypothetical protein
MFLKEMEHITDGLRSFQETEMLWGTKNVYTNILQTFIFFNALGTLISQCFQLNEHKHADRT